MKKAFSSTQGPKPAEFIAVQRAEGSAWHVQPYSSKTEKALEDIAPDGGNHQTLLLIDHRDYLREHKARVLLQKALEKYQGKEAWAAVPTAYGTSLRHSKKLVADETLDQVREMGFT